jgi:hypothetical protein
VSRDAKVVLTFLDGEEYLFRLAWGQLIRLQESRKLGPFVIFDRLHGDDWMVEDIRDVIRFGFVGGGMAEVDALKLVRQFVEAEPPFRRSLQLARKIMEAGVIGPEDIEDLEKKSPETASESTTSTTAESASPNSTGSLQ